MLTPTSSYEIIELERFLFESSFDDKRCVQEDGVHTLAWGHCDIPRAEVLIHVLNHSMRLDDD